MPTLATKKAGSVQKPEIPAPQTGFAALRRTMSGMGEDPPLLRLASRVLAFAWPIAVLATDFRLTNAKLAGGAPGPIARNIHSTGGSGNNRKKTKFFHTVFAKSSYLAAHLTP